MKNTLTVIFGGSGFIGTHLIEYLIQNTLDDIVCVDVIESRIKHERVNFILGDVRDLSSIDIPFQVDKIFNLAAVHTTPGHLDFEYFDTNVSGAVQVLNFARRHRCDRVIFTSSISVYGPGEDLKDENSTPNPVSAYGKSKLIAEDIHRDWLSQDSKRRLVISRPAVIFGAHEGGNFTRLAKMIRAGLFIYPGRTDTIKSCFYVKDLVDCLHKAAKIDQPYILFNGCYPDSYTISEIVNVFRHNFFPNVITFKVPLYIVMLAASLMKPFSSAGLGIHPERIIKMVRSTNIYPGWLIEKNMVRRKYLSAALSDWSEHTDGRFN